MYELQGECDAIRQGRVTSLVMDTVRMASDEVVKADLLQRNAQLLGHQEKQHKLLSLLCRRLAVFVTLESALENERSQMIELNRLAISARNLCEEILRTSSDRGSAASNALANAASAEELGSRLLHQVLALDSRHRPSEFTPKRDVVALAERHGAQARAMSGMSAGAGSHCEAEVEQCKTAAGALQAMLYNDFQQPELLPPEVLPSFIHASLLSPGASAVAHGWFFLAGCEDVRNARRRDRRQVFRSGSGVQGAAAAAAQLQQVFHPHFCRSFSVVTDLRRSRAVDKKLRELMAMFYTQPVVCAPAYAGKVRQSHFDSLAGAAARVHGRFAAPGGRLVKCFSGLWTAKRAAATRASALSALFLRVF
jgi:hypothetical protein